MHTVLTIDRTMFYAINRHSVCSLFDLVMPGASDMTFWAMILVIFLALMLYYDRSVRSKLALVTLLIALVVTDMTAARVIKPLVGRLRPCHDKTMTDVRLLARRCGGKFSFPSNHAANSAAIACAIGFFYRKLIIPLGLVALTVGFSRIYLGVHFPLDVACGYLLGIVVSLLTAVCANRHLFSGYAAHSDYLS